MIDKMFSASDAQIGERLHTLVTSKQIEHRFDHPGERQAVVKFYADAQLRAAVDRGRPSQRARQSGDRPP